MEIEKFELYTLSRRSLTVFLHYEKGHNREAPTSAILRTARPLT